MQRLVLAVLSLGTLAACDPTVPDSGAGVGFGSYDQYRAQREAELTGSAPGATTGLSPQAVSSETTSTGQDLSAPADPTGQFADEALATVAATQADGAPAEPAPGAITNSVGISSENDFGAVSSTRSIEQDAARVAANREAYVTIEPGALPTRSSREGSGATLVQYALSTSNTVGQPIYSRLIPGAAARQSRNCAKYPSPDLAQADFLASGGPERNAKGLDADGDGFACSWDPAPFRLAAGR